MEQQKTKDTQSRAYCFTINNYADKGFTPEKLEQILQSFPSMIYYCYSLEIGSQNGTPHMQCYFKAGNPVKFSTLKNKFKEVNPHFEVAKGTARENRDYVSKGGKWADTDKAQTSVAGTFKEWGKLPEERQGERSDLVVLYDMIKEGYSNAEILNHNPEYIKFVTHIEKTRQILKQDELKNKWRDIECIYVYGKTGTGKTRTYMEKYGYENVYRITNYNGNAVWDGYQGQPVVIFEEYRSQLMISEILTWTEGYPNSSLRARYADKVAAYTTVIFISNISLKEQYPNIQKESPETWRAFLRRIQKVIHYKEKGEIITYNSVEDYLGNVNGFITLADDEKSPFDD